MDAASPLSPRDRLGSPPTIAAAAAAECRKLGFFARRPLVTYVAGPILLVPVAVVVVLFAGCFALSAALASVFWLTGIQPPEANVTVDNLIAQGLVLPLRFLPFALAAWFFCRLARRHPAWHAHGRDGAVDRPAPHADRGRRRASAGRHRRPLVPGGAAG